MDTTIRDLDPEAYRRLKAHAALTGKSIGEALNEAIRLYLSRRPPAARELELVPCSDILFEVFETFRNQPGRELSFADAALVTAAIESRERPARKPQPRPRGPNRRIP